jgi:hypothetical protein
MYGLAQCTRDLNGSQCTRCITSYAKRLGELFPNNTGGAIKGYNCYLRYLVALINITLPPVAAPAPPTSSTDCDCRWRHQRHRLIGIVIGMSICSVSILIILGFFSIWLLLR